MCPQADDRRFWSVRVVARLMQVVKMLLHFMQTIHASQLQGVRMGMMNTTGNKAVIDCGFGFGCCWNTNLISSQIPMIPPPAYRFTGFGRNYCETKMFKE